MKQRRSVPIVLAALAASAAACMGDIAGGGGDDDPAGGSPSGMTGAGSTGTGVATGPGGTPGTTPGGSTTPGAPGSTTTPGTPGATPGGGAAGPVPTGPIASVPTESTRFARLSHKQYENTLRDLLRMTTAPVPASSFVTEPVRGTFDNNGGLLQVAPAAWLDYQRAAETVVETVMKDPRRLAAILPANLSTEPAARARGFVEGFGLRAYRRPLTMAEVDQYLALFNKGPMLVASGNAFNDGVQLVLALFLQSPHFIYRTELSTGPQVDGKVPLSDYEIASKLSYGLVNTMPDDALFAAAAQKRLSTRDGVLEHAKRLLATQAAQRELDDFHYQLLDMIKYDQISKDTRRFPEYKSGIGADMRNETLAFVRDVLIAKDKGLTDLLVSPYSFVNSRVAPVYGLSTPTAPAAGQPDPLVKVELDPTKRAGLLTQVGFLAAYADGSQPQTILRGAFINREILCQPLPPPPDAFMLPASTGKTNRQRVETATHTGACAGCHQFLINPPGYALEGYDALGRIRTTDNGLPVDTASSYPFDGEPRMFNGGVELSKLVAGSRQAHDCYSKHWLEYVYGRLIDRDSDKELIAQLGVRSQRGAPLRSLLLDMVATDAFLTRTP